MSRNVDHLLHGSMLGDARERLGVHALTEAETCGYTARRQRSLAAVLLLINAAKEVAKALGGNGPELFIALCAAEVPEAVTKGLIIPDDERMQ